MPRRKKKATGFSVGWTLLSLVVFVVFQVGFGYLAGQYAFGHYTAAHTKFLIEGTLVLVSYFMGALLIGVLSPDLRLTEPVIAAFLAMAAAMSVAYMTPVSWFRVSLTKFLVGSAIACGMALAGVITGERLTGELS